MSRCCGSGAESIPASEKGLQIAYPAKIMTVYGGFESRRSAHNSLTY